jgi:predicted glycosyltransferase
LGGYNTTMNILRTGVNSMILPSNKDWEQMVRAEKLAKMGILELLEPADLQPQQFAEKILRSIETRFPKGDTLRTSYNLHKHFDLDGAEKAKVAIANLLAPLTRRRIEIKDLHH